MLDWGRISDDYLAYRSGPPPGYYDRLKEHGVGLPGQRLLDVGTGTGVLAREFAKRGCKVSAADASAEQVERARREKLPIDFRIAPAESMPFESRSFEAVTANQCWHFFDGPKAMAEIRRVADRGARLVVSDLFWLASKSPIAAASEDLILKYSPAWDGYRWEGANAPRPDAPVEATIEFDVDASFTRESWRGRLRTCRVIGPTLPAERLAEFDAELAGLLEKVAPERFGIPHRILAHVYRLD